MLEVDEVGALALDHLNTYLKAYEDRRGARLDDESGVDACAAMLSALAALLDRQLGEKRTVMIFATFLGQLADGVDGVRMDVVQCEKLPDTPQEAMAMSLEKEGAKRDRHH